MKVIIKIAPFLLFLSFLAAASETGRVERGPLVIEGIPEIPPALSERLRQYANTRSARFADWLPNGGGLLVTTRFGDTRQVHRVAEPGGAREQLTFFEEPVYAALASPSADVNGFIYERDVGGSEFYQLYFFDLATGRSTLLTDGESRNGEVIWANDGRRYVYQSSRRNGQDFDLWIGDVTRPGAETMVLSEGGVWYPHDWSPDDRQLLVERYISRNESQLYVLDLASTTLTPLLPAGEQVAVINSRFAPDGAGVYYTSDEGAEFVGLRYWNIATGDSRAMTAELPWDVEDFAVSEDGRMLALLANTDGASRLRVIRLATGEQRELPGLPSGVASSLRFEPGGRRLALALSTPRSPGDVYTVDLAAGELVRWTRSELGGLDAANLQSPDLIRFPTFDRADGGRRTIPAWFYRPAGEGPFPGVIGIHGGPEVQDRPVFRASTQFMVNELGVAVLRPNVRGSSGYGKTYLKLDNGRLREDSVRDIGALLDWIEQRPDLDPERVAVVGGSYGGYMVLASLVHYGDRLRAGVDVVGISNFVTFLENTEAYRRDLRRVEYGDERDPSMRAFLDGISPNRHAGRIRSPLFIAQGLNDPRVPVTESEQMVEAIRANGGEVWYLMAKNEGHGFARKSNRDYFTAAMMMFFEQHLLPPPARD